MVEQAIIELISDPLRDILCRLDSAIVGVQRAQELIPMKGDVNVKLAAGLQDSLEVCQHSYDRAQDWMAGGANTIIEKFPQGMSGAITSRTIFCLMATCYAMQNASKELVPLCEAILREEQRLNTRKN